MDLPFPSHDLLTILHITTTHLGLYLDLQAETIQVSRALAPEAHNMEDQLLRLLSDTHSSAEGPRKLAEQQLQAANNNPAFPGTLAAIASHASVSPQIRQSALVILKAFVEKNWSGENEDGEVCVQIDDPTRETLRNTLLELATTTDADRKIRSLARFANHYVAKLVV